MDKLHDELIAFLGGELAPEDRSRVERRIDESKEARAELDWLRAVFADIETVEASAHPRVQEIDIVESVMRQVQKASPANVVSIESARPQRKAWLPVVAAAAAVLLAVAYFFSTNPDGTRTSQPGVTNPGVTKTAQPPDAPKPKLPSTLAGSKEELEKQLDKLDRVKLPDNQLQLTQGPTMTLPGGVSDVATALASTQDPRARMAKLLEWARLPKKNALDLASAEEARPEVVVGAAQSLSGEEQRRVLLTAVGKLQEDPSARLQLALNYMDTPAEAPAPEVAENQTQAVTQLSSIKEIDPDNALPYYFEAKTLLERNDIEKALQALQTAGGLDQASAYSLESALAESAALEASGMDPEAARMVAALTAGVDENNFLCQLAGDLLSYGQGFLSENNFPAAEAIFKAVEQLGRQVESGASFSQEQLAGLDIQRSALGGLGQLYETVESAEGVATVTDATNDLTIDVEELHNFFVTLDEMFLKPMTTEFWNIVSGIILGSGDLALMGNEEIESALAPSTTP